MFKKTLRFLYSGSLIFIFFSQISCSTEDNIILEEPSISKEEAILIGTENARKKAYQMTDIEFTPLNAIEVNFYTYEPQKQYKGVIYSSVKELETYVGDNVSLYTYMTAINNPKSKIYTEKIDKPPYHGTNSKAYYGTVCSAFVSVALGLNPRMNSFDYPTSELFEEVDTIPELLKIADVLWVTGHVGMITDIEYDNDKISRIEISEAIQSGCRRFNCNREQFAQIMTGYFTNIYRYKEIYKNLTYTPVPEIVAVATETPFGINYNQDLCLDKGDKSNYLEMDSVVINIFHSYDELLVYKDGFLHKTFDGYSDANDVVLKNLSYGSYSAIIKYNGKYSEEASWIVVNVDSSYDFGTGKISFCSKNGIPDHVLTCNETGTRPPLIDGFWKVFDAADIQNGYVYVDKNRMLSDYPYIELCIKTDYGKIIAKPYKWTN